MNTDSAKYRRASIGASATALMTLVAIAATVSAAPTAAQLSCTAVIMEQSGVRGVAAVVAAAAREFFTGDHQAAALIEHRPQHVSAIRDASQSPPVARTVSMPAQLVGLHLLNLPPPAC